ncbi:MAG: hypothetical protein GY722_20950 [bacterium]|nr:hypothetical protein [bacterium]
MDRRHLTGADAAGIGRIVPVVGERTVLGVVSVQAAVAADPQSSRAILV